MKNSHSCLWLLAASYGELHFSAVNFPGFRSISGLSQLDFVHMVLPSPQLYCCQDPWPLLAQLSVLIPSPADRRLANLILRYPALLPSTIPISIFYPYSHMYTQPCPAQPRRRNPRFLGPQGPIIAVWGMKWKNSWPPSAAIRRDQVFNTSRKWSCHIV